MMEIWKKMWVGVFFWTQCKHTHVLGFSAIQHSRAYMSPGLLQLTVLRHHRGSDEPAAVCRECDCTFVVGRSTLRPHHASATGAALASSSTSCGFQVGHPGLPVTIRHRSSLSGCRLSVGLRRRSSSAAFCHIKDVCCETNLQQLWRQLFCSCRSKAVEQPSSWSVTSWHCLSTI